MVRVVLFFLSLSTIFLGKQIQLKSINDAYFEELTLTKGIGTKKAMQICIEKDKEKFSSEEDFKKRANKTGEVVMERLKKQYKF